MIPDECASIRSMARCVLPVLVGPSTAVTPAPGARSLANVEGDKAIFFRVFSSGAYLLVIARSDSDEAIHASASSEMDCFASLAMTKNSEIPSLPATTPARSVSDCDDSSDHMGFGFTLANGCGTNRGRIADSLW